MATLILDPYMEADVRKLRAASGADERYDEVWDGVSVMSPSPNIEHFRIQRDLMAVFMSVVDLPRLGETLGGTNVSDRVDGWTQNYRVPDLVVYLAGNPAVNHGTFWHGGPDIAVEIVSPGEEPNAKLAFYFSVGVRETLLIHRDPWAVELFVRADGRFESLGRSDSVSPVTLTSGLVPLTFRLVEGPNRSEVEVGDILTRRTWRV